MATPGAWDFIVCDGGGTALTTLTRNQGTSLTFTRNGVPECTFSLSHDDDECATILDALANGTGGGVPTLKGYRVGTDGVRSLRFNGYLAGVSDESGVDSSTGTFTFRGPFGRLLGDGSNRGLFLGSALSLTALDAGQIARQVLLAAATVAEDDFTGAAGNLNGRSATAGGTWATSGAATDFTGGSDAVSRSATGTRYAILAGDYDEITAQVNWSQDTNSFGDVRAIVVRWTDANNYLTLRLNTSPNTLELVKVVGGSPVVIASKGSVLWSNSTAYSFVVQVGADGSYLGQMVDAVSGAIVAEVPSGTDTALATGGTLASGGIGFLHTATSTVATITYDSFRATAPSSGILPLSIGSIQPSKTRDRNYPIGTNRGEAIVNLTNVLDGFDFEVLPVNEGRILGDFTVYARQGQDQPHSKFEYGPTTLANCLATHRQTLPPVNYVTVIGANGLSSTKQDASSIARYGRYEYRETQTDVSEQATLDDKAYALLRPNPVKVIDFTPEPRLAPSPWDDYWIGDTVQFYAKRGALKEGPVSVRVNQITVAIDPDTGLESATIPDPVTPDEERVIRASIQTEVTDGAIV